MRGDRAIFLIVVGILFISGCYQNITEEKDIELFTPKEDIKQEDGIMKLTSSAFKDKGAIPIEFSCKGSDISPPLTIAEVPKNAKSLAMIMDDPDAPMGIFVHWVIWNIPPDTKEIEKGADIEFPQGMTDFGKESYGGPCPPSGTHRYFFKLYALDILLDLAQDAGKVDLEEVMKGHIMAQAQLMGTFTRQR